MTDIVKVLSSGIQVYPQTHASAVLGLEAGGKGDKGDAATITVGTVTSGVTAAVTNAGTSSAARFNFVLPKGDKGDQGIQGLKGSDGIQGPKGDQGPAGQNATTTAIATTTANGLMSKDDKIKLNGVLAITFEKVGTV